MRPAPRGRRGPGGRQVPIRIDRSKVAQPWAWTGLCAAINPVSGTLRDYVVGVDPTTPLIPTVGKDDRGNQVHTFTGSAAASQDFPDNGLYLTPVTGITVFCRWKFNGTNPAFAGQVSKVYATISPFTVWGFQHQATANAQLINFNLEVSGTQVGAGPTTSLGTSQFINMWGRWSQGGPVTAHYLTDGGGLLQTFSSANQSGTILYPGTIQPLRIGGNEAAATSSPGGSFSTLMQWNRSLSDQEMVAITLDPFGFLRT